MRYVVVFLLLIESHIVFSHEYTVGVVPQFSSQKLNEIWQPLLVEVSNRTGVTLKLVTEKSIPAFEKSFQEGKYDFAYMNPWHSVIAYEKQGYIPFIKDGSRKLRGILVVNKEALITNITELDGYEVAFPSANALGASLLIRSDLKQLFDLNIKPLYVKTHPSVYFNVALKKTIAGGGVMGTLQTQPKNLQEKLKVIYQTREVSPHPITSHPRVPLEVKKKIQTAFIAISNDPHYQYLLNGIPIDKAVEATTSDYAVLKEWGLDEFYVEN